MTLENDGKMAAQGAWGSLEESECACGGRTIKFEPVAGWPFRVHITKGLETTYHIGRPVDMLAQRVREALLVHADTELCLDHANRLVNEFLNRFNELSSELAIPDSILTRLLVARAIIHTAGSWLSENVANATVESAIMAAQSVAQSPPQEIGETMWNDTHKGQPRPAKPH